MEQREKQHKNSAVCAVRSPKATWACVSAQPATARGGGDKKKLFLWSKGTLPRGGQAAAGSPRQNFYLNHKATSAITLHFAQEQRLAGMKETSV